MQAGSNSCRHAVRCSSSHRVPRLAKGTVLPSRQVTLVPGKAPTLLPPSRLLQGSSSEDPNPKWVINLSSKPLTQAQRSVLAKGPNFVVSPKDPPNLEYITPKPNLTKAQNLVLRDIKRDMDCIVLTVDKGVAMVIMDRQDYINKANSLLNQNTYRSTPRDPTNTIKIN